MKAVVNRVTIMPIGKTYGIRPEDIICFPKEIIKMSEAELIMEHKNRVKKAPSYELGKPPREWILHDELDYMDELELF